MRIKSFLVIGVLSTLSFSSFSAEIKVSGGAAPMNSILKKIKGAFEKKSGHTLVLAEVSPELALQSLEKGEIQVASAGLRWEDWLKLCEEKGIKIDEKKPYKYAAIGKDTVQVFVHKTSLIKALSGSQIDGIFTGKISNWKEVGGPDKKIVVVFGSGIAGTNKLFKRNMMSGEYTKDAVVVKNTEDIAAAIGKDADAIGFGPSGVDTVKFSISIVATPEVSRPIFFAYMLPEKKEIIELKDFILSAEAQELIKN